MTALTQEREKAREDLFVASLSHEVKRHLAALHAATSTLDRGVGRLLEAAQGGGAPPALEAALAFLTGKADEQRPPAVLTGLEGERRIAEVAARLGEGGISAPLNEKAARVIVQSGWLSDFDRIAALLEQWGEEPLLSLLEAFGRIRSNLATIRGSVDRLMRFAEELRAGMGGTLPDVTTFRLRDCLERGVAAVEHERRFGTSVEIRCDPGLRISASPAQIEQVVANLVGNAQRAVRSEGGRVSVEAVSSPEGVLLSVEDDGAGIPEEIRPRLFTPFFTGAPDDGGTGLGLYIARRIVEGHGGTLRCNSRPGRTRFEARLPRKDRAGKH